MQLEFLWGQASRSGPPRARTIDVDGRTFPIVVTRHTRARRYILRLDANGALRLTVPRRASVGDGLAFVARETAWIAREWQRRNDQRWWQEGSVILFRGERVTLERQDDALWCGTERIPSGPSTDGLRAVVESHLRTLAARELPARCLTIGAAHGLVPARVSVRNQRSRWGACSPRGVITLNWRLVQMPAFVADYVISHELAHLDHLNHSRRFWRRVADICPEWQSAERWLRTHGRELL